jgi:hypothetical protein
VNDSGEESGSGGRWRRRAHPAPRTARAARPAPYRRDRRRIAARAVARFQTRGSDAPAEVRIATRVSPRGSPGFGQKNGRRPHRCLQLSYTGDRKSAL